MPRQDSLYTKEGLKKLSLILKNVRAERRLSQRELASLTGVSHATISRIESCGGRDPEDQILALLALHVGHTFEELKAIATERDLVPIRSCRSAEEWVAFGRELPPEEFARGVKLAVDQLLSLMSKSHDIV